MASESSEEMANERQAHTIDQIRESIQGLQEDYERVHSEHMNAITNMEKRMSLLQIDQHQVKVTQDIFQTTQDILENQTTRLQGEQRIMADQVYSLSNAVQEQANKTTRLEQEVCTTKIDASTSIYDQKQNVRSQCSRFNTMEKTCTRIGRYGQTDCQRSRGRSIYRKCTKAKDPTNGRQSR